MNIGDYASIASIQVAVIENIIITNNEPTVLQLLAMAIFMLLIAAIPLAFQDVDFVCNLLQCNSLLLYLLLKIRYFCVALFIVFQWGRVWWYRCLLWHRAKAYKIGILRSTPNTCDGCVIPKDKE